MEKTIFCFPVFDMQHYAIDSIFTSNNIMSHVHTWCLDDEVYIHNSKHEKQSKQFIDNKKSHNIDKDNVVSSRYFAKLHAGMKSEAHYVQ